MSVPLRVHTTQLCCCFVEQMQCNFNVMHYLLEAVSFSSGGAWLAVDSNTFLISYRCLQQLPPGSVLLVTKVSLKYVSALISYNVRYYFKFSETDRDECVLLLTFLPVSFLAFNLWYWIKWGGKTAAPFPVILLFNFLEHSYPLQTFLLNMCNSCFFPPIANTPNRV